MDPLGGTTGAAGPGREPRLRLVIEAAPNAMIVADASGRIVLANTQTEVWFGYTRDELLGMQVEDLMPERLRTSHRASREGFSVQPDRRELGAGRELFGLRKDGSEIPIEIGLTPVQVGEEQYVLASVVDITERQLLQAAEDASRQDRLRRSILDSLPLSVLLTDAEGTILTANPAAERLLGYRQGELIGSSLRDVDGDVRAADRDWARSAEAAAGAEREWVYRHKDGRLVPVSEAVVPVRDARGQLTYLTVAYDITKRIEAQARVDYVSTHDLQTGLPNRACLVSHLIATLEAAHRDGSAIALLVLDLDHFKRVNETLGHHRGDELVLRVAERLRSRVGAGEFLARLGGDEFVLVAPYSGDTATLTTRAERLLETLEEPMVVDDQELVVTASIGGATYPCDAGDASALLQRADTAMYHAKASGRNQLQWFAGGMLDDVNDRVTIASALRSALRGEELSVAYQAQVDLRTGEVVGIEALARWHSPKHGTVPPDRFIPVAEDDGLIGQLGAWVLRQACRDAVRLEAELGRPLKLAVNVSPRQFEGRKLLGDVVAALEESGLDPTHLELEITEGTLMDDQCGTVEVLQNLRARGVSIAVDDFGRGYSSLAYLTRFPVDKLKIDRSFVQGLGEACEQAPIIDAIIVMAHALGMTVVAEGVETEQQERYLRERGCEEGQGFRYSPGVPADQVAAAVRGIAS